MTTNDTSLLLRLSTQLKADLQRAAFVNKRTVTAEIQIRLQNSLLQDQAIEPDAATPYTAPNAPAVYATNDNGPAGAISGTDQAILRVFRALPVEKQLALLSLLR